MLIFSHIQAKKEKTNDYTLSSTDEVLFFRGKIFKKATKKGSYNNNSEQKTAMMLELKVLSNISFFNGDKYESIIEFKKIDDKKKHQEFNFYFKINPEITKDAHYINKNVLYLNPRCHIRTKRCGYYLDYLWQKRDFLKPIEIKELMEKIEINKEKFLQRGYAPDCRSLVEISLNMLKDKGIIQNWDYYDWKEN